MTDRNNEILEEAIHSLEIEGFYITDSEKTMASDMLEGKRTLPDVIAEIVAKGNSYARV
jgi:hypothetical protein